MSGGEVGEIWVGDLSGVHGSIITYVIIRVMKGEEVYYGKQAREVIRYVREEYGGELEFLWQDENGVWRNPGNRKWYGVMMRVRGSRLGLVASGAELSEDGMVEILDLRFEKGMAREFVASRGGSDSGGARNVVGSGGVGILPGYHMNKNNWITVVLDYEVATEEVLALIGQSYRIVAAGE